MPQGLALEVPNGGFSGARTLAPPRGFRGAHGVIRNAQMVDAGPWGRGAAPLRGSAAKKAGLRYERKVISLLNECFEGLLPHQWFKWTDETGVPRWCQTDAVLPCADGVIIFEVKIRGTGDAWWQLHQKYRPVVEQAIGKPARALVQICRSFDPAVPYPCEVHHLEDISQEAILACPPGKLICYSWRL